MKPIVKTNYNRILSIIIYFFMFIFFIIKVNFYTNYVARFPDETQHISYIAYLEQTKEVIPNFKEMKVLDIDLAATNYLKSIDLDNLICNFGDGVNYLGHPPLYYHIMRLSNGIVVNNDNIIININKIRFFSHLISYLALLIVFYIGYTRIDRLSLHLLYSAIIISVPMFPYISAGVNNDTLSFLGISIIMIGLIRFSENNRKLLTYNFISIGVLISFLSKLTSGFIILIAGVLYIIYILYKEKSFKFLICKEFIMTCPIYGIVLIYYMYILLTIGNIQPSLAVIAPDYFKTTIFYVPIENRVYVSFAEYAIWYINRFFKTWVSIYSHVTLVKPENFLDISSFGILVIFFLPLLGFLPFKSNKFKTVFVAIYIGVIIASIYQFFQSYSSYKTAGRMGAYQSRYYLCALPALAMLICISLKDRLIFIKEKFCNYKLSTKVIDFLFNIVCILFVSLLIYEDFIYFILNFNNYL